MAAGQDKQNPLNDPLLASLPVVAGYRVLDRLIMLRRIGAGGMGIVYRAWHIEHGFEVAVKVLKAALALDDEYVQRFRREAQLAMGLTHQNVVRVFDVRQDRGLHYIVMEYVDGETVPRRVERWGRMRQGEAVTMLAGAAAGLAEAHQRGIVHRDIKPDNLILTRSGRVKLADLGLARLAVDEAGVTVAGSTSVIMGTPQYMSPEQWETPNVKAPADVWALGATFFYLVTGEHAVPPGPPGRTARLIHDADLPSLRERLPGMQPDLHVIYERCVRRRPEDRFADAGQLLAALQKLGLVDESLLREEAIARPAIREQELVEQPSEDVITRIRHVAAVAPPSQSPRRLRARPKASVLRAMLVPAAVVALCVVAVMVMANSRRGGGGDSADASAGDTGSAAADAAGEQIRDLLQQASTASANGEDGRALAALIRAQALGSKDAATAREQLEQRRRQALREALLACVRPAVPFATGQPTLSDSRELTVELVEPAAWLREVRCGLQSAAADPGAAFFDSAVAVPLTAGKAERLVVPADGEYLLRVSGRDDQGFACELPPWRLCIDSEEPLLRVEGLQDGQVVAAELTLRVGCSADATVVRVMVAGRTEALEREADDRWRWTGSLPAGAATLRFEAVDAAGNTGRRDLQLNVDAEPPTISVEPVAAYTNRPTVAISGQTGDAARVVITARGSEIEAALSVDRRFVAELPLPDDGSFEFAVVAIDAVGNRSEQVEGRTTRHSVPPIVTWSSPAIGDAVPDGPCEVKGRVDSAIPIAAVTCNGKPAELQQDGSFAARVEVRGRTRVEIVATDAAGNVGSTSPEINRPFAGEVLTTAIGVVMRPVPAGEFRLGDAEQKDRPVVKVSAFWLAETEVTRGQWRALGMAARPEWGSDGDRLPVEGVSHGEAREFCRLLEIQERRAGRVPPGFGYELPSEAQWEYACRAGSDASYCFGDSSQGLPDYAVADDPRGARVVGERKANAFGLFDMHGNVEEWCRDRLDPARLPANVDPLGDASGQLPVRGGSYQTTAYHTRSSARDPIDPSSRRSGVGFRPAIVRGGR